MELMEGGELFELIRSKKRFTEKEAATFTRQVGSRYNQIITSESDPHNYVVT